MSPKDEAKTEDGSQHSSEQGDKPADGDKESNTKRRTKTGCLTCRKRRIKCGEERPVCKNCIKSKRECSGYGHPVTIEQSGQSTSVTASASDYAWHYGGVGAMPAQAAYGSTPQAAAVPPPHRSLIWQTTPWTHDSGITSFPPPAVISSQGSGTPNVHSANISEQQYLHLRRMQTERSNNTDTVRYEPLVDTESTVSRDLVPAPGFASPLRDVSTEQQYSSKFSHSQSLVTGSSPTTSRQPPLIHRVNGEESGRPSGAGLSGEPAQFNRVYDEYSASGGDGGCREDRTYWTHRVARSSVAIAPRLYPFATSPLLEEKSQSIFRHFLSVTGPCMSTFERHDHPDGSGLPKLIWTHSVPAMAFSQPALAHAVLALGAMHMAKLQLCNEDVAVKHFTLACRRVGKLLGETRSHLEVSLLAAVLLLGYYEVVSGDHSRWNLHLTGACKLIMEHNYSGMMRGVRRFRSGTVTNAFQPWEGGHTFASTLLPSPASLAPRILYDDELKIDQNLVSRLMGLEVNYDTQLQPNFQSEMSLTELSHGDIEDWRTLLELYWWYCKQDVFHSLLSGDRLLLPYSQWKYCPPRGTVGNIAHANATMDYLWLLLARLTNFSSKDRERKQQVVRAQGGHWIPAPGFLAPIQGSPLGSAKADNSSSDVGTTGTAKPSANEGRARKTRPPQNSSSSQPEFHGMMPSASPEINIPPSMQAMNAKLKGHGNTKFDICQESTVPSIELWTEQAIAEHISISQAFDHFESLLGIDFQPTSSDDIQINTPFGPAIRYRSPVIATMWSLFLVGKIVLRRAHPHSPPAAMVSAAVNTAFTKDYALLVGRICGGLFAQHSYLLQAGHVNHTLSAAVMEITFPLLFAAVQYQDSAQRYWTISKLNEIRQITGWQTSAAVASACETTWEKLGLAQKGPPYKRTMDHKATDDRVSGKYSYTYGLSPGSTGRLDPESKLPESRFISHDRGLIDKHVGTRVHWALGLLSVEEDLSRMAIGDDR